MKKITWQKCEVHGAGISFPNKEGLPLWDGPITPGLHVDARYCDIDVHLHIKAEIKPDTFSAIVMHFGPSNKPLPNDILENDEVEIPREFICWHYKP